jgi:hypothetical protein
MKTKIYLTYLIPAVIFFFFSFNKSFSQIEIDTSKMGPPDQNPTLDDFKDSLSSKGEWVKINKDQIDPESNSDEVDTEYVDEDVNTDYVWVPSPIYISVGWSPYCYGRWIWTYWGWEWVPYYDWGWCTYHYGRWWYSDNYGWCWSPGRRWRSHWVTWCHSGGYWGWHPLSPRTRLRNSVAVLPVNHNTRNGGWVFVDKKNFSKPINNTSIVDPKKNTEILKNSKQFVSKDPRNKITSTNTREQNSGVQKKTNDGKYFNNNSQKKQVSVDNKTNNNGKRVVVIHRSNNNNNNKSSGNYKSGNNGNRSYNSSRSNNNSRSNSSSHSSNRSSSNSGSRSSSSSHNSRK